MEDASPFSLAVSRSASVFVAQSRGSRGKISDLASVHFTCKISRISIFPRVPVGQKQIPGRDGGSEANWLMYSE